MTERTAEKRARDLWHWLRGEWKIDRLSNDCAWAEERIARELRTYAAQEQERILTLLSRRGAKKDAE